MGRTQCCRPGLLGPYPAALGAAGYKVRDSGPQQAFMAAAAKPPSDAFHHFQRGDIIFGTGMSGCV